MMTDNERVPPVKVGDELEMPVVGFGKTGDPMLRIEGELGSEGRGYVIFVKDTNLQDLVLGTMLKVKIDKVFPNFGLAELA